MKTDRASPFGDARSVSSKIVPSAAAESQVLQKRHNGFDLGKALPVGERLVGQDLLDAPESPTGGVRRQAAVKFLLTLYKITSGPFYHNAPIYASAYTLLRRCGYHDREVMDMGIKDAVVARFAGICAQRDMKYNELAVRAGVTPSTVYSMMDPRRRDVSIVTIKILCDGLDMTLEEFFSGEEFAGLEQEIQ